MLVMGGGGICEKKRAEGRQEVWGVKLLIFIKEVVEGGLGHLLGGHTLV